MATVYDPNQEDEENQQPGQPQQVSSTSAIVNPGSPGVSASPGTARATPSPTETAKQGSGRFVNLQKYIQANQGTDYAGKIGQQLQQQKGALEQGVAGVSSQVESAAQPEIQRLQGAQQQIQQAITNPSQYAGDAQNVQNFQQLLSGQTANVGQDISTQQQQAKALQERAALSGTESGRYQLLRDTFESPSYSRGQTKLDQLLLQGQSGQLRGLQKQSQQAAQAGQKSVEDLQGKIQGYQQQIGGLGEQARQAAQTGIQGAIQQSQADLQQRAQQEQAARQQQYASAVQGLRDLGNTGYLDPAIAQQLGIQEGSRLYGVSGAQLQNLLEGTGAASRAEMGLNPSNVATQEDAARMQALSALSGQDLSQFAQGTPAEDVLQSIRGQFENLVGGAKGQAEQEFAKVVPQVNTKVNQLRKDINEVLYRTKWGAPLGQKFDKYLEKSGSMSPEENLQSLQNLRADVQSTYKKSGAKSGGKYALDALDSAIKDLQTGLTSGQFGRKVSYTQDGKEAGLGTGSKKLTDIG